MALDAQELARKLHDALAQKTDGNGQPTPVSDQTLSYSKGIVAALKAAVVSNAPGTITGVTAPGSPLSGGAGSAGVMILTPGPMEAETLQGVPPQALPNIAKENVAIVAYLATGLVTFAANGITGTCTSSSTSPGPLAAGAGLNGTITGLTGAGATAAVSSALGAVNGPDMIKHYTALINYVLANATATYASGSITGVCPPGGGPLGAGAGAGGTLS